MSNIQFKIMSCTSISSLSRLNEQIEQKLNQGWNLHGPISVTRLSPGVLFICQILILKGKPKHRQVFEHIHRYLKCTYNTPQCDAKDLNDEELMAQIQNHPALQNYEELLDS